MATNDVTTEKGMSVLYANHHTWLCGWLRQKLGNDHDAADIAHDTFVRVLNKSEAQDVREPRPYLSTIARGLVTDFFRHRRLETAYLDVIATLPEEHVPSLEARAILMETLMAIDAMLDGMKPVVRETFLLSQLEGCTYEQIADRLHISKRTVSNHMAVALEHCYMLAA
jgi:RNA polymerase sigma factor (sigma-70 family)